MWWVSCLATSHYGACSSRTCRAWARVSPPQAKHIHSRIGTVVAQREHHPQPVVKHVRRGYPAHDAGLQVGDEVLGVDDEPVKDLRSLHDAVYSHSDVQTWHIARHGQRHAVTIQKRPGTGALTGRSRR